MTLNELIGILQDHAKGHWGDSKVRMVSHYSDCEIQLLRIEAVQVTPLSPIEARPQDEIDHVRLVFLHPRAETR